MAKSPYNWYFKGKGCYMSEGFWIALLLLGSWAFFPICMVVAGMQFDGKSVKEHDEFHH
jgi:hypothetical protein